MSFFIHPHASVHPSAIIREGAWIGPHVMIGAGAVIGHYSVIGGAPEHSAFYDDQDWKRSHGVDIEPGVRVFEFCTIQAGTERATRIRGGAAIFQHAHVSHDCDVGAKATICGRASLAGFVETQAAVTVGAHAIVHQHCVLGAFSMLGMASVLRAHIRPGQLWVGYPARVVGVNEVGLERAGIGIDQANEKYFADFETRTTRSKLL